MRSAIVYIKCRLLTYVLYPDRYHPISAESFDTEVYSQFYDPNSDSPSDEPIFCHRLSVMFMVLAIGSLMNPTLRAYNLDAEVYHQLARAALFHHSFIDDPTITAVQALVSLFPSPSTFHTNFMNPSSS